jgi:hypothetical protein
LRLGISKIISYIYYVIMIKTRDMKPRSKVYVRTEPMISVEYIERIRKELTEKLGPLRLRGRHSDRKLLLGKKWRKWNQNDIPWKQAETVDFYIHDNNPNYRSYYKQ